MNLIGRIPFEEVKSYYSKSIVGINYHQNEIRFQVAIPLKIFEYMKHKLIVVTSDLIPIREFVKNDINGSICKMNTPDEFARLIIYNLNRKDKEKIGELNRDLINKKYNWDTQEEKLLLYYKKLLEVNYEKNNN